MPNFLDLLGGSSTDWTSLLGNTTNSTDGTSLSSGLLGGVKPTDLSKGIGSTTISGIKKPTSSFGNTSNLFGLGSSLLNGVGTLMNTGQISSKSQKTEALADGAVDTISNVANAFGPVGSLVGLGLKLVNGVGGSLMNHNSTAKAVDNFKINNDVQQSSSYGGTLSGAQDAQGDGQGYKKAGLAGKLFTNTSNLKNEFNTSAKQQNMTAGVLALGKQSIQGGLAGQDMYTARNQNSLYGGSQWNDGSITYGKQGMKILITQHGGKVGVPRPGPEIPHGGVGAATTRPTMMQPAQTIQKVENKGDLQINANQRIADSLNNKTTDDVTSVPSTVAPFPVSSDILSMVSQALSGTISGDPTNTPVDPNTLPTMQMGGQLAKVSTPDDITPMNTPIIPPTVTPTPNKVVPNPSAMVGSLANNTYKKLTPGEMQFWNGYVDYVASKGYKGSPDLDVRDKGISKNLYDEYAKTQNFATPYDHFIPAVQSNIKQQRQDLIDQARQGKAVIDGMINKFGVGNHLDIGDEQLNQKFMSGLSQVDGWAGSKTTSYKFPMLTQPRVSGFIPGETLRDQNQYKQQMNFTKFGSDVHNGGINSVVDTTKKYKEGGIMNVIVDGHLHAHKHNMEDLDCLEDANITTKGIPVVAIDAEGGIIQQAEVERDELILHYDLTKQLEKLMKEGTDESAIEAGKLLAKEIVKNTKDSKSKILKIA